MDETYEAIAVILRHHIQRQAWEPGPDIAADIAEDAMSRDPSFDRAAFLAACGVDEPMTLIHDNGEPYTRDELEAMRAKDRRGRNEDPGESHDESIDNAGLYVGPRFGHQGIESM